MAIAAGVAGPYDDAHAAQPKDLVGAKPFLEVWDEEIPVMGHLAVATDGTTWKDAREDDELFDGPPDVYGCKSGLVRLPYNDRDILVFSAPGRRDMRNDITVWVSFDGGESWPVKRLVKEGPGNCTWLAAGRRGTPSEGRFYLVAGKDWMARFNLAWIMENSKPVAK